MIVVLPCLCLIRDLAWKYAKRMYFPQSYHHVQEIQKYNIQDYRPRYVLPPNTLYHPFSIARLTDVCVGWNNSKRPSEKCGRCNGCESSAGTLSRKRTSRRHVCCRLTIPRENVGGMVRWLVVGGRSLLRRAFCLRALGMCHVCMYVYRIIRSYYLYDCDVLSPLSSDFMCTLSIAKCTPDMGSRTMRRPFE